MAVSRSSGKIPHQLGLVIDFVNTLDREEATDEFATSEGLQRWLTDRGLLKGPRPALGEKERRMAIELREALRSLMLEHNGGPADARAARVLESVARGGELADGLERLAAQAQNPSRRWWAASRAAAAAANAGLLHELAALLRERPAPQARGVAMVLRLLADGTGPMYDGDAGALERELRDARAAIAS